MTLVDKYTCQRSKTNIFITIIIYGSIDEIVYTLCVCVFKAQLDFKFKLTRIQVYRTGMI